MEGHEGTPGHGERLAEFEIEKVLGAGGFGVTYLARDTALGRRVAVKEYLPREWGERQQDGTIGPRSEADAEDYRWGLERFLEEARVLARFDDPHIVRVHRVFEAQGSAYLVTEYVQGRSLAQELRAEGPWAEERVRWLLDALTSGLTQVHAAGLLHRDIKPANVMLRTDGAPVLIDFGAAREVMGRHSRSVTSVVTPGYAPIEQYSTRGRQGPWTDIYALGAVAYVALSGRVPDDATERVRGDELPPVAAIAAQPVSAGFGAAVMAALAVGEGERPQDLGAWRASLEMLPAAEAGSGMAPVASAARAGKTRLVETTPSEMGTPGTRLLGTRDGGQRAGDGGDRTLTRRWLYGAVGAAGVAGMVLALALAGTGSGNGSGGGESREAAPSDPSAAQVTAADAARLEAEQEAAAEAERQAQAEAAEAERQAQAEAEAARLAARRRADAQRRAEEERRAAAAAAEAARAEEMAFWASMGSPPTEVVLQEYLRRWPDGTFAVLATARLKALADAAALRARGQGGEAGPQGPRRMDAAAAAEWRERQRRRR